MGNQFLIQSEREALMAIIATKGEEQAAKAIGCSRLAMVRALAGLGLTFSVGHLLRVRIAELTREAPSD